MHLNLAAPITLRAGLFGSPVFRAASMTAGAFDIFAQKDFLFCPKCGFLKADPDGFLQILPFPGAFSARRSAAATSKKAAEDIFKDIPKSAFVVAG